MNKPTLLLLCLFVLCAHCDGSSLVAIKEGETVIGTIDPGPLSATVRVIYNNEKVELLLNDTVIQTFSNSNKTQYDYEISKLEPCTNYKLTIRTHSSSNKIIITHKLFRTNSIKLSSVESIQYNTGKGLLTWMPPKSGSKCIKSYTVQFNSTSNVTNSGAYSLAHLSGCLRLEVQIKAMNTNGIYGKIATQTIQTGFKKPTLPLAPKLIWKTATSFLLKSGYENDQDLCTLKSAKFTCVKNDDPTIRSQSISLAINVTKQKKRQFSAIIHDLEDLTNYTCSVRVENAHYSSDESPASEFETNEKLSGPPEFSVSSIHPKSLRIAWNAPNNKKLRLKSYWVRIRKVGKNYVVYHKACKTTTYNKTFIIDRNKLEHTIKNLEPFTKYTIEMAIENTAGIGDYSSPMEVVTNEDTPHQVNNFRPHLNFNGTVKLSWSLPCEINGEIKAIKLKFYVTQPPNTSVINYEQKVGMIQSNYQESYLIKPEHLYNITIGIELHNFTGPMNETSVLFTSPAEIPAAYGTSNWGSITKTKSPRDHVKLIVNENLFNSANGIIRSFTFLISERKCQKDPQPNFKISKSKTDLTSLPFRSWFDIHNNECAGQYQIQELYNINENGGFEFIIGNETCDETKRPSYCNGPLKSGTQYAIIGRVFTSNSYGDTNPIHFETENNFTILIVIIVCILISGLFVGFGIKWYISKQPDNKDPPALILLDLLDNETTPERKYRHFLKYDLDVITNEYRSINDMDLSDLKTDAAEQNQWKNRYANIMPYDQNRVCLIQSTYCSTDYINASFVNGFLRPDEYIATQGPTVHTCYDFWSMIIEKNCNEIIMLTKLNEDGIPKCDQYYPYPNGELKFYDINVANVLYHRQKLCIRREMKVTRGTVERLIVQYHFENWSDHSGLDTELDLIELIEFVRAENRSNVLKTPIVVHCSAGSGRTGTFIALDILMQQIESGQNCNVCETVKNLRCDRMKMVQTLVQYEFLYKCVACFIRRKWPNIDEQ